MSDLKKMKIAELKKELSERGLSTKGNKPELLERLQEFLDGGGDVDGLGAAEVGVEDPIGDEGEEEGGDEILEEDDEVNDEEETEATKELSKEAEEDALTTEEQVKPELQERNPVTTVTHKIIKITAPATDEERKRLRAQKYSLPLKEDDKKAARAKRFGGAVISNTSSTEKRTGSTLVSSLDDRLKKRAERFGTNVAPKALKAETNEKLLKRKQRFGGITSTTVGSTDIETKKKMRAERFGVA